MPKISVVIPTHNCGRYICEAIDSAINQTFKDIEIIVVDDGSTDYTKDIINDRIQEFGIRYIRQAHKGPSSARNRGIYSSMCDYLAFLDADDVWASSHLEQILSAMMRYPNCDIGFSKIEIFGNARDAKLISQDFKIRVERTLKLAFDKKENDIWISKHNLLEYLLEFGFSFRCQASLIKRQFLLNYNLFFDEEIFYTEDAHFMTMAAFYTCFLYVDKLGVLIRRMSGAEDNLKYGTKIFENYDIMVKKYKKYFYKKLDKNEKKALKKCLWSLQVAVMVGRSKNQGRMKKIIEGARLLFRVPCLASIKSVIKLFLGEKIIEKWII